MTVSAQKHTLYMDSIQKVGKSDTVVSVSIRTKNFTNVVGIQGSIHWDTAFITCNGVSFGNTDIHITYADLNLADTSKGQISIGWLDNNLIAESVADNSILLTLYLKVKKMGSGGGTTIRFVNNPTTMTLIDGNFKNITDTAFIPGYIGFKQTSIPSVITVNACGSYQWNGMKYNQSGHYEFITKNSSNVDSTAILALTILPVSRDTVIGNLLNGSYTWHGQSISQIGYYRFDTLNSVGCDSIVTLQLMATLPILFSNLSSSSKGGNVLLSWTTLPDLTIDHFMVEQSIEGHFFTAITKVEALDNSENKFAYIDSNLIEGNHYYRIVGVNKEGQMFYSKSILINKPLYSSMDGFSSKGQMNEHWEISPNPCNGNLQLNTSLKKEKEILFELVTPDGKRLFRKKLNILEGIQTSELNLNERNNLSKGVYFLQAVGVDGNSIKKVFIR